jgi:hypothetical protein
MGVLQPDPLLFALLFGQPPIKCPHANLLDPLPSPKQQPEQPMASILSHDQRRPLIWTAIAFQLVYLALSVQGLIRIQNSLNQQGFSPAMSSMDMILAALPAVLLWGMYALVTRTALHSRHSPLVNIGIMIGGTLTLCLVAFAALFGTFAIYAMTHAPH